MGDVSIRVKSILDSRGFDDASRQMAKIERESIAATRRQIAEHRKVAQLTAKLDKELAGPSKKASLAEQFGAQFVAANVLKDVVTGIGNFTVESLQAGMAAERLGTATDNMAASFGASGEAITDSIQRASQYTINQMDAMGAANQAMLLGVAKSPAEFDKLTRIAVSLGRAMGQDATKSIGDMTIGLGRQSKLILDNLGLMVDAEKANEKYAASVGKSADELTDAEKKQAFINEALAQGEAKVAALGNSGLDSAGKVEQLTARWQDFGAEFGKILLAIGDAGSTDMAFKFVDGLTKGAEGWSSAIKNYNLLAEAQGRLAEENEKTSSSFEKNLNAANDWINTINPMNGLLNQAGKVAGAYFFQADDLAKKVQEVAGEHQKAVPAVQEQVAAEEKSQKAMEDSGKAADELAKKLAAANAARRDVAGGLMDIQDKAAEDTAKVWDDYYKEEQGAWKDHSKNVEKINADSEKERVKIQKDLAKELSDISKNLTKDLAKEDKDLARDLAKIKRDSERDIGRRVQDTAREEKKARRQQQIDAKGDQRLFNFEMGQLAAEGEFNAILAAKERRAIEQQIAGEKTAEEQRQRDDDSRVEIERMRQDATDQLAERKAQAEERKQELMDQAEERRQQATEQAAEEEVRRQEELAQALADEQANYEERLQALRENRDQKLAEIEETKNQSIAKLAEELTQTKDLTRSQMEDTIKMASEFGPEAGRIYAEGMNDGFSRNLRINELANVALGGGSAPRGGTVNPAHPTSSASANIGQRTRGRTTTALGTPFAGFAGGVDNFIVPPGFPNDSFTVGLTSGEAVSVKPAGQSGGQIVINQTIAGGDDLARRIAVATRTAAERVLDEFFNETLVPWSNGQ